MSLKEDAVKYWDRQPCNSKYSDKPIATREYFKEVDQKKLFVEPHILRLAEGDWKDKCILDVGCGLGTMATVFARAGARVYMCDSSLETITIAVWRPERIFGIFLADAENMAVGLSDLWVDLKELDLVWCFGVMHHLEQPEKFLNNAWELLKPGGELRLMVYHRWSWKRLKILLGLDRPEAQAGCPIWRTYTKRGIKKLLKTYGFEVKEMFVDHIFPWKIEEYRQNRYVKVWYFRWMPDWLFEALERWFGWHLCVIARKTT